MRIRFLSSYLYLPLLLLAVGEGLAAFAAVVVVDRWFANSALQRGYMVAFAAAYVVAAAAMGLYSSRQRARIEGLIVRIIAAHAAVGTALAMANAVRPHAGFGLAELVSWVVASTLVVTVVRITVASLLGDKAFARRVLIYGAGRQAASIVRLRRRSDTRGFEIVGYVPADREFAVVAPASLLEVGAAGLRALAESHRVDEIVVAMDDRRREFPVRELLTCRVAGIEVADLVTFLERETGTVRLDVLNPSWIIFSDGFRRDPMRRFTKRLFDLAASAVLLAVAWPVIVLTAVAIKLEDGWRAPLLYRQRRVGFEGVVFEVLKFRSMRTDAEKDGRAQWATTADPRVTRVGGALRKTRIDELPQIINVFRGQMSFVGPRPERPEFVADLGETIPYFHERHCVRPGITGWAQICYPYGASEKDAAEKLQYDLFYVKHHTLLFDLVILLQTVEVVLFGKGGR